MPASIQSLTIRSQAMQAVRDFFRLHDFIEVETPVRICTPANETHINAPPSGSAWLRTSPELHMKRIICSGATRIFQLGPCFREGESGRLHSPEFTMLEWYRADADYLDILKDSEALLQHVAQNVLGSTLLPRGENRIDLGRESIRYAISEIYQKICGWDPATEWDPDRFDLDMVSRIEPSLAADRMVALMDYPAPAAALARLSPGDPLHAERFELYAGGMELINAFSELTDADEQRKRFEVAAEERRSTGDEAYPLDEQFLDALKGGMPRTAGAALGFDRLVMLLTNSNDISHVRALHEV